MSELQRAATPWSPAEIVTERRQLRRAGQPALEWVEARPAGGSSGAPLLFVHGAFTGAWSWEEGMLDFFARRGRRAAAVSLRGHGASEGGPELRRAGLDDLLADLRAALAEVGDRPVLIGHSLGGFLAQCLIGHVPLGGLVLMGSLPADGLALIGPTLALTEPRIWLDAVGSALSNSRAVTGSAHLGLLFGQGVPPAEALRHAARMVPESPRALAEAHLPRPIVPAWSAGLPTLVVNGTADLLVWPLSALRTALYHGAAQDYVPGGGHFLMLDVSADGTARTVLDWLCHRGI